MAGLLIRLLSRFLASWSTPSVLRAGRLLGSLWFHVIRVRRGVAERAVARAFPEKSAAEVRAVVKGNFQHLMTSLLESLAYVSYPESRLRELIRFEGMEESVLGPRRAGRGVVAISAHIGNFEMCTDGCGLVHELPMLMVARLPKGGFARALLDAFRSRNPRMQVFEPKGSAPRVVEALRTKQSVLAFVVDQNLRRGRGVFVPFLGELANTTTGFASLQRKADAALCVVQMYRAPDGTHRLKISPVTPSPHPNLRIAMIEDTLVMSNHIQRFVREHPEQWFWVHRRWKARPEPGDLVRADHGLERFGRGRVAAFLSDPSPDPAAVKRLEDAGVAVFRGATAATIAGPHGADPIGSLFAGADAGAREAAQTAGMRLATPSAPLLAEVDAFLEWTVRSHEVPGATGPDSTSTQISTLARAS